MFRIILSVDPSVIALLRINEYGGKDRVDTNDWDYWENTFNYAFYTTGSNYMYSTWSPINGSWDTNDGVADSISFRFKTNGLPFDTSSIQYQNLWQVDNDKMYLTLRYEGTGYNTHPPTPNNPLGLPYSGSIVDPYYQYAYLDFYPDYLLNPLVSASIYLPFYDGGWWSVMINRSPVIAGTSNYVLYSGNKIYEGGDNGTVLGFYDTSSVTTSDIGWISPGTSYFARGGAVINGNTYQPFSGSLQEVRYFTLPLSESIFKDYIMNPHSIEGTTLNSTPDELIFRASLGGELYTESISIHPKITGSWITTSSFVGNIGLKHLKVIKEDTISKWDKLGFLEGLKGHLKENVAQLYENQASHLINEATSDGSSGSFETVVFPIVRRVFSKLLANDIVSVQAMNLPIGKLFYFVPKIQGYSGATSTSSAGPAEICFHHPGRVNKNRTTWSTGLILKTIGCETVYVTASPNFRIVKLKPNLLPPLNNIV